MVKYFIQLSVVRYFFSQKEKKEREKELKRRYGASGLTHGVVAYRVMCHWAGRNRGKPGESTGLSPFFPPSLPLAAWSHGRGVSRSARKEEKEKLG